MPPIISIVGRSGSGKTTLIEKLIPELKRRGYKIGTVKHASHRVEMDQQGKDSWRHKQSGADTVIVASKAGIAMVKDENCDSLDGFKKYFDNVDLILTEGYKSGNKPKIEVVRAARHQRPICQKNNHLEALVSDVAMDADVPRFGLEDVRGLADMIEGRFLGGGRKQTALPKED